MKQVVNGAFHEVASDFGSDNDSGLDLSHFNHVGDEDHSVEQSQAGIADVEHQSGVGQLSGMMDATGGCRFELIATDGAMNQGTDVFAVESRLVQKLVHGLSADGTGERARIEKASFLNACHQFQSACGQTESIVHGCKLRFDLVGSDDVGRQGTADSFDANMLITHKRY